MFTSRRIGKRKEGRKEGRKKKVPTRCPSGFRQNCSWEQMSRFSSVWKRTKEWWQEAWVKLSRWELIKGTISFHFYVYFRKHLLKSISSNRHETCRQNKGGTFEMKKKLISALLCLTLAVSMLTACGGGSSDSGEKADTTEAAEDTSGAESYYRLYYP